MARYLDESSNLQRLFTTLEYQLESAAHTSNIYARNAQLLALTSQSLHIEFILLDILKEWTECRQDASPWPNLSMEQWKKRLLQSNIGESCMSEFEEEAALDTVAFDIFSTLITHHVFKEMEDDRAFYDLKEDGFRGDNANALEAALNGVAGMDASYALEVAEDAISQLVITIEGVMQVVETKDHELVTELMERRSKAGRKPTSCFLPQTPVEALRRDVGKLFDSIAVDNEKVQLGGNLYDRKYVFVLLYYRFISQRLAHRKLNVLSYSLFLVEALNLPGNPASFRKSLNNWIQKIALYDCTFEELTMERIRNRRHECQMTKEEFPVWTFVSGELEKVIDELGLFV